MKYFLIPFVALGITLSMVIGVEYNCDGREMFPIYYGSPFVFMQKSLASSMEYYYSVSGLFINVLTWSIPLSAAHFFAMKLIRMNSKIGRIVYGIVVGVLSLFTIINLLIATSMLGRGFDKHRNYWYWNLDAEAKAWGMECDGEWKLNL